MHMRMKAPMRSRAERNIAAITRTTIWSCLLYTSPVLRDFCLRVSQGQTVALVGETGSGKSTIVNLLCRFYEPCRGKIIMDGRDLRDRSVGWLHSHIGYVPVSYTHLDVYKRQCRGCAKACRTR